MNLRQRTVLYYFFVLLFVIISPIILLYSVGYTIDVTGRTVQRSGMILLDVYPADAIIAVNGSRVSDEDRSNGVVRLTGLAAGSYEIEISKDGYEPWQTTLEVSAGAIAAPPTIRLVRTTRSFMTMPLAIQTSATSPAQDSVALIAMQNDIPTLIVISTSDGTPTKTVPMPGTVGTIQQLLWSPDGQKIVMVIKQSSAFTGVVYDRSRDVLSPTVLLRSTTRWENDSQRIVTTDGRVVSWITPFAGQSLTRTAPREATIQDLYPVGSRDMALIKTAKGIQLAQLSVPTPPQAPLVLTTTLVLPNIVFPEGSRIAGQEGSWMLITTPTLTLALWTKNNQWEIQQEIPAATIATISRNLLYTVDSQILYAWDPATGELLQRPYALNDPPKRIAAIPETPWIAVATDSGVWLHQRPSRQSDGGRPQQDTIPLESGITTRSIVASPNGRFLLLSGSKGTENGLFLRILSDRPSNVFSGGR